MNIKCDADKHSAAYIKLLTTTPLTLQEHKDINTLCTCKLASCGLQDCKQQMQVLQHQLAKKSDRVAALERSVARLEAARQGADKVNQAALLLPPTDWPSPFLCFLPSTFLLCFILQNITTTFSRGVVRFQKIQHPAAACSP